MLRLSYWVLPVFSGLVWLGMLLGLLIYWCVDTHFTHYSSMSPGQNIAYISDVGASKLKPLFIAGCCVTTVSLDLSFLSDHWLRHRGRLVPNANITEKILSIFTIIFAAIGTCGLILLSIFDTVRFKKLHDIFLLLFIAGYVLSAICICWQYQRLGVRYREHRVLRLSFWIKLVFVIVEVLLAIAFVACNWTHHTNAAAVLEWLIAFLFSAYIFSFFVDLYPAVRTRKAGAYRAHGHGYHPPYSPGGGGRPRDMEEVGSDDGGRLTGGGLGAGVGDHRRESPNEYLNGAEGVPSNF